MWQQGDADVCAHESIQQCSNTKTKKMKETWSKLLALGFSVTQKGKILINMKQLSFDSEIKQTFTIVCFLWTCQCFFGFHPISICMQLLTSEMTGDTFRLVRWMLCAGIWTGSSWFHLAEDAKVESVHSEARLSQSAHTDFSLCSRVSLLLMVLRALYNINQNTLLIRKEIRDLEATDTVTLCYINKTELNLELTFSNYVWLFKGRYVCVRAVIAA